MQVCSVRLRHCIKAVDGVSQPFSVELCPVSAHALTRGYCTGLIPPFSIVAWVYVIVQLAKTPTPEPAPAPVEQLPKRVKPQSDLIRYRIVDDTLEL